MTQNEKQNLIEKLLAETKKLATPIDFIDLEKNGILVKDGAWYRVPDFRRLPEHISLKVREIAVDSKGAKVKLYKATSFEKLVKKFEKLSKY